MADLIGHLDPQWSLGRVECNRLTDRLLYEVL